MPTVPGGTKRTSAGIDTDLRNRLIEPGQIPGVDPRLGIETVQDKDSVIRPIYRYTQMFDDVQYPWDPSVIRAIRDFDPRVVPVTTVSIYKTPANGILKYVRHAIALEVNPLEYSEAPFYNLLRPTRGLNKGYWPNVWLKGWCGPQPDDKVTPGDYWPLDWRCYKFLKERFSTYDDNATKVVKERVDREEDAKRIAQEKMKEEIDYRWEQDKGHIAELAGKVDISLRKRGVMHDTTPNPFVYLKS